MPSGNSRNQGNTSQGNTSQGNTSQGNTSQGNTRPGNPLPPIGNPTKKFIPFTGIGKSINTVAGIGKSQVQYLNLLPGKTTFTINFISQFRTVHFVQISGALRKIWCSPYPPCTYCQNGERRVMRLSMEVIHNGDIKTLEVGSSLGHKIMNATKSGETVTVERIGTGFSTRYNLSGILKSGGTGGTGILGIPGVDTEEGIKELMYDIQRTIDYVEKYDLIKEFARKY